LWENYTVPLYCAASFQAVFVPINILYVTLRAAQADACRSPFNVVLPVPTQGETEERTGWF
jgi:hypothetical protein